MLRRFTSKRTALLAAVLFGQVQLLWLFTASADAIPYVALNKATASAVLQIVDASVARSGSVKALQNYELRLASTPTGTRLDLISTTDIAVASTQTFQDIVVQDESQTSIATISGRQLESFYLASLPATGLRQLTSSNLSRVVIYFPVPGELDYVHVDYLEKPPLDQSGTVMTLRCDSDFGFVIDLSKQTSHRKAHIC